MVSEPWRRRDPPAVSSSFIRFSTGCCGIADLCEPWHGFVHEDIDYALGNCCLLNLAAAVPLVAVAAVFQGQELEERRVLVPGVVLLVAWVFELGSSRFINTTDWSVTP